MDDQGLIAPKGVGLNDGFFKLFLNDFFGRHDGDSMCLMCCAMEYGWLR